MVLTKSNYLTLKKGARAPDFELPDYKGKTHKLSNHKGTQGTLIVFMCNHCPYVIPKAPFLAELEKKYKNQGLSIIGINANDIENYPDDAPEFMKSFATQNGFSFPYLFDESQNVAKAYGGACTPDPFLFDADLKLVYHGRIDDAHGQPHAGARTNELEQAIVELLTTGHATTDENPSQGCNIKWKTRN